MTWKQIKEKVEALGVEDEDTIDLIEITNLSFTVEEKLTTGALVICN